MPTFGHNKIEKMKRRSSRPWAHIFTRERNPPLTAYIAPTDTPNFIGLCTANFSDADISIRKGEGYYFYPVPLRLQYQNHPFFAALKTPLGFVGVKPNEITIKEIF